MSQTLTRHRFTQETMFVLHRKARVISDSYSVIKPEICKVTARTTQVYDLSAFKGEDNTGQCT